MNLLIWIAFLSAIGISLMAMNGKITEHGKRITAMMKLDGIARELEEMQATGFTVSAGMEKHKQINGSIALPIENGNREIFEKTIYGVEMLNGQPV
ncbi:MAG: hypothetical protein WCT31_03190 [Candidatus Micrarchaeia archaeon]